MFGMRVCVDNALFGFNKIIIKMLGILGEKIVFDTMAFYCMLGIV